MSAAPGPRDAHGNPVSVDDPASLARVDDFVAGFVMCEARVVRILEAAAHDASNGRNTIALMVGSEAMPFPC